MVTHRHHRSRIIQSGNKGPAEIEGGSFLESRTGSLILSAGELGAAGDGKAEDAAAVELGEGEDVADGLIAETEAAAFLFGQALGGDVLIYASSRWLEGQERQKCNRCQRTLKTKFL
jgi:hypothetical protein